MITSSSLWPKGIENQRTKAPIAILREQASILGQITKNLVQGEVLHTDSLSYNDFSYEFYITAPSLGHYKYQLLTVHYGISLYPVKIEVEEAIQDEIEDIIEVDRDEYGNVLSITAETEEEFLKTLKAIFNTTKTNQVITALLSQTDPGWEAKGDWPPPEDQKQKQAVMDIPF